MACKQSMWNDLSDCGCQQSVDLKFRSDQPRMMLCVSISVHSQQMKSKITDSGGAKQIELGTNSAALHGASFSAK